MNKLLSTFFLTIALSIGVYAQNNDGDYKRNEFYVGYSNQQVSSESDQKSFNGFEFAYVRNVHRYLGVKGDFSAAYKTIPFTSVNPGATGATTVRGESNYSLYNVTGGIQLKNNASQARFKPFAHGLVGVAFNNYETKVLSCTGECSTFSPKTTSEITYKSFTGIVGGGLDVKINQKVNLRAIQIDYNPVYSRARLDNVRFGAGIVF